MKQPFTPPEYGRKAFNCPHCNAYSSQSWHSSEFNNFSGICVSKCQNCNGRMIWCGDQVIMPKQTGIETPNRDLSEDVQTDYIEASNIVNDSPRGACALLRLAIQKLCVQLGEKGKNINDDIGNLVKKGLPPQIQQALDIVRIVGNNAVHPGEIDLTDNREIAMRIFSLINFIAAKMITEPKQLEELYKALPPKAVEAIEKRDKEQDNS